MVAKFSILSAAVLLPSLLVVACGNGEGKKSTGRSGEVGTAQLFIREVPSNVRCVRVTASGSRTRTDAFDVTPAESAVLTMEALPAESVTFTGDAFPVACADIGTSTRPTWLSDPVTSVIVPGEVTDVSMVMRPVGGARIDIDFTDAGAAMGGSGGSAAGGSAGSAAGGSAGSAAGGSAGSAAGGSAGSAAGGSAGSAAGGATVGTWDQSTWDNATWQ